MRKLHLICNAHLDPIWLWEWEEGASAALSTFRSAVNLAEEFDYIFCHNEVTLYKWVEEYDKETFEKIKELIKKGKWQIVGGWYLQPDCNMPSGESFIRQIMVGRKYFHEKFNAKPTTAVNFDPFGHSYGLPQILCKTGYDSYLCCRPSPKELDVPDDFIWEGVDGSRVKATRVSSHYNSALGKADEKIQNVIKGSQKDTDIVLWGVGNHGGGPSREDLTKIDSLMKKSDFKICHSTPEEYFKESENHKTVLKSGISPCMPGCYTSQVRVKLMHRELENQLFMTEKMLSHASVLGLIEYPHAELSEAIADLLNSEFHDVLPGTGIKPCEEYGLRLMHHGLEILNRLRAKAFFALSRGECLAEDETYPILAYNPHPYKVSAVIDVGFNLADQNYEEAFTNIVAYSNGVRLKTQLINPKSSLNLDWMKRVLFECTLEPMSINRFDCKKEMLPRKPKLSYEADADIVFSSSYFDAVISKESGLLKSVRADGKEFFRDEAFSLNAFLDNADPWAMSESQRKKMGEYEGQFSLMDCDGSSYFSGALTKKLKSVRVIEDGEVCTVVESVFKYHNSESRTEYVFYKNRKEIDVNIDLFFMEKNKMIKLKVPFAFSGKCFNDIAFGKEEIPCTGREAVMQRFSTFVGDDRAVAILNNGIYGMSATADGEIFLSLVRGAGYSAHPIFDRELTPSDRFISRMDQGERNYSFKILFGEKDEIERSLEKSAAAFSQKPFSQCVFPSGKGERPKQAIVKISNEEISLVAFKQSENGEYVIRLHNNHGYKSRAEISVCGLKKQIDFDKFEVKTLSFDKKTIAEETEIIV